MEGNLQCHQTQIEIHLARNFSRQNQRGGRETVEGEAGEKQVEERGFVVTSQQTWKGRFERGKRGRGF